MDDRAHPAPLRIYRDDSARSRLARWNPDTKITRSSKTSTDVPPNSRHKRVFGTSISSNFPSKPANEKKLAIKPKPGTKPASNSTSKAADKNSIEKEGSEQRKKKSVCFEEKTVVNVPAKEEDARTPVASSSSVKPRRSGTPYYTADKCSKCRFDRIETASYWLAQIKLAESVGKHFVSGAFFRLAHECKAEPFRNLKVELKRYMARHPSLSEETLWRDVSVTYGCGVAKDEKLSGTRGSSSGPESTSSSRKGEVKNDQGLF